MISAPVMRKQVGRMLRLPFAPSAPEDLKGLADEYARVLNTCCKDDRHCAAIIDAVIDTSERVPPPSAILSAAETVPAPNHKGPMGCTICAGSGWQSFTRNGYDCADFCPCDRGEWMKACEKQRNEEKDAKARRFA